MYKLFVGIDVAKDSSTGHGLDGKGESLFSMAFPMDIDGFSKLFDALKGRCGDLSEVLVAMESTACYHINLFSFLTSKGVTAVVLNPLLVSILPSSRSGRQRQTRKMPETEQIGRPNK